jgi:hypothetical protein
VVVASSSRLRLRAPSLTSAISTVAPSANGVWTASVAPI